MAAQQIPVAYGLTNALQKVFSPPIIALRAPTTADKLQLGTMWIYTTNNATYVLTSIINNLAAWSLLEAGGGGGVFATLTVNPGPTSLSTVGNGAVSIGNATNTGAITMTVGTGNLSIVGGGHIISIGTDAAANAVNIGSTTAGALTFIDGGNGTGVGTAAINLVTAAAGDIAIGAATHTGAILLGNSTANETISIGTGAASANTISVGGTGANVITIGNTQVGGSVTVGNAMVAGTITLGGAPMTGNLTLGASTAGQTINIGNAVNTGAQSINIASGSSAANSTVSILAGVATAGTQTFNVLNGLLSTAGAVNIGTGTAAHVVTLGSITGAASTTIQAGTGSLALNAAGAVSMAPAVATVASATTTVTMNSRVGRVIWTGFTTANAGGTQVFTFTNSTVTVTSAIFVTVTHLNASTNGATLRLEDVTVAAGSFTVKYSNNGAGALGAGDNIITSFWVLS